MYSKIKKKFVWAEWFPKCLWMSKRVLTKSLKYIQITDRAYSHQANAARIREQAKKIKGYTTNIKEKFRFRAL